MLETTALVIFVTSLLVGYSGALMPGPLLTMDISESARRGFWAGPALVLGHALAEAVIVVVLAAGLSRVFQDVRVVMPISLLGGIVLLWMGFAIVRSSGHERISTGGQPKESRRNLGAVWNGALVSVANPGWVLWWATVGTSYILWSLQHGPAGIIFFYSGHLLADLSWYSFVSFAIASGRRLMNNTVYRGLLLVCGLFLIALGGYFFTSGIRYLL